MNAAFLLMSTAALTGADAAPPAVPAPTVITSGAGCGDCGAPAPCGDCGKAKVGLFDKLKSRFGGFGRKSHDCGCAPAPVAAPCHDCATTVAARPNLLDKLKSRMGHKKCDACGPVCDPCGAAPLMTAPGGTTPPVMNPPPPKEMPKVKEVPKGNTGIPVPPVAGAGALTGAGNPY